jgi:hypothetical protein
MLNPPLSPIRSSGMAWFQAYRDSTGGANMKGYLRAPRLDEKFIYEEIPAQSRDELKAAFASQDEDRICEAMYSAARHETDWRWTQHELLGFLTHKSIRVRSAALVAIGEVAIFQRNMDLDVVLPQVHKLANDPALVGFVEDCLDDIKQHIRVQ